MQFVDSQEYSKFTRIVFDTAPTVSRYIIKADCSLIDIHLPNGKRLIGTYTASFNTARLSGCFYWKMMKVCSCFLLLNAPNIIFVSYIIYGIYLKCYGSYMCALQTYNLKHMSKLIVFYLYDLYML